MGHLCPFVLGEEMITIICGDPGAGKTALMTYFALSYLRYDSDYLPCLDKINEFNSNGFHLSTPNHLVFTDWKVILNSKKNGSLESYFCNGYYLGMPNNQHRTMFLPPYSKVFLSEAQRYYNSRNYNSLSDFVSQFYEQHRHWGMQIFLDCQRATLIDLNIRGIATRVLFVQELLHDVDIYGRIVSSTWKCRQFRNVYDFDNYLQTSNHDLGQEVEFVYNNKVMPSQKLTYRDTPQYAEVSNFRVINNKQILRFPCNIFEHFASTNKEKEFLRGRNSHDFSLYVHPNSDIYVDERFDIYSFETPRTFYKLPDVETKQLKKGVVLTI